MLVPASSIASTLPPVEALLPILVATVIWTVLWGGLAVVGGSITIGLIGRTDATALVAGAVRRPGPAFAVGFVAIFVPLSLGSAGTLLAGAVPVPARSVLVLVAGGALLLGLLVLVVGTGIGTAVVGRRIADRGAFGSLFLGVLLLAPTQVVPVINTVVVVVVGVVGTGALCLRWYAASPRHVDALDALVADDTFLNTPEDQLSTPEDQDNDEWTDGECEDQDSNEWDEETAE